MLACIIALPLDTLDIEIDNNGAASSKFVINLQLVLGIIIFLSAFGAILNSSFLFKEITKESRKMY